MIINAKVSSINGTYILIAAKWNVLCVPFILITIKLTWHSSRNDLVCEIKYDEIANSY